MLSRRTLFVIVLVAYVSYRVYKEPVPPGCSEPLRLKLFFSIYHLIHPMCLLLDKTGLITDVAAEKYLIDTLPPLLHKPKESVVTELMEFNGVPVRVHRPKGSTGVGPAMVYYHGGGWVIGSSKAYHGVTEFFADETKMVVVSVDYRLNPEFSQQDGLDDCVTATKYFIANAEKFSVDPKRVVVAGDSAGGNYAAAVSLYLRDQKFSPMPKLQLLIYPATQLVDLQTPSYQQNWHGPFLKTALMFWFASYTQNKSRDLIPFYEKNEHVPRKIKQQMADSVLNVDLLPKEQLYPPYKRRPVGEGDLNVWNSIKDTCLNGYHFPLFAKDHSNLPEAYVFTAQYDPLRDDGYFYAHKLREAGVTVTHYNCPFGWHAMINTVQDMEDSRTVLREMSAFLKQKL